MYKRGGPESGAIRNLPLTTMPPKRTKSPWAIKNDERVAKLNASPETQMFEVNNTWPSFLRNYPINLLL